MKIAMATLGCKVNQSDAATLAAELAAQGHEIVSSRSVADVYILHTCTVTQKADYQSRQLIRRAIRQNPSGKIIITGCYAQTQPEVLKAIPGVDWIVGVGEQEKIPVFVDRREKQQKAQVISSAIEEVRSFREERDPLFGKRNRAYLKVQDGCNSFCSYCIVPYTRGRNRSLPWERALSRVQALCASGFQEIILTGIHLGTYGEDLIPPRSLADLLPAMEGENTGLRLRLSSIEPREVTPQLIAYLSRSKIVCPHLHIPLQSGDDGVLQRMNRDYSSVFFEGLVNRLIAAIPGLAIGIDVIGGFPGEDDRAFQNTVNFIERLPIAYLHVFPFSKRKGTKAASFPEPVPSQTIKARCQVLRDLGGTKRRAFYQAFLGKKVKVLVESRDRDGGFWKGYSPNYIPVLIRTNNASLVNQQFAVELIEIEGDRVWGVPIKCEDS